MKTAAKGAIVLLTLLPVAVLLILAMPQLGFLWQESAYWCGYANSVLLTVPVVFFQMAVALPCAYGLARWKGHGRNAVFLVYSLLTLLPCHVMLLPNYLVCKWLGLLNHHLAIVLLGMFSPLSVFLLGRGMQKISPEQAEAASLDGAGEWTIFTRIYLPQVRDVTRIALALAFLDTWSLMETPLVLLSDETKQPLSILLASSTFPAPFSGAALYMLPVVLVIGIVWSNHERLHGAAG